MLAIVTGANRGIGLAVTLNFAKRGIRVVLACRSPDSAREAISHLTDDESIDSALLSFIPLDLASPDSIRAAVATLRESYPEGFDILVNNAGIGGTVEMKAAGTAACIQIDYFGPAEFTRLMRPSLKTPSRIVNVSSRAVNDARGFEPSIRQVLMGHNTTEDAIDSACRDFLTAASQAEATGSMAPLLPYNGLNRYTLAKLALNGLTRLLHLKWGETNRILVTCCCPGWCSTRMGGSNAPRTPKDGAAVVTFLALDESVTVNEHGGKFFEQRQRGVGELVYPWVGGD